VSGDRKELIVIFDMFDKFYFGVSEHPLYLGFADFLELSFHGVDNKEIRLITRG
jgi:hypothetical protein